MVDAATKSPVAASNVTSRIQTSENTIAIREVGTTDQDGVVVDTSLSRNAAFEICAFARGYLRNCVRDLRMGEGEQSVTLSLQKRNTRDVRILTDRELGAARIFIATGSTIIAMSPVINNTFQLDPQTPPTSLLYLVSNNYPLTRFAVPDLVGEDPVVHLAPRAGRSFTVSLPSSAKHSGGPMAIELGGVLVPEVIWHAYRSVKAKPSKSLRWTTPCRLRSYFGIGPRNYQPTCSCPIHSRSRRLRN